MKNIQVIDGAVNTAYAIYAATDDEFARIFPGDGQDIEFIEDFIDRVGETAADETLGPLWDRLVDKKSAQGIHGTLFYELTEKRKFYENKREPVIDWKLVDRSGSILPGTGRGTMRSMVEGHVPQVKLGRGSPRRGRPSTSRWLVPLPRRGRIE